MSQQDEEEKEIEEEKEEEQEESESEEEEEEVEGEETNAENEDPLPPGWSKKIDSRTGRHYYLNHKTKTTSWELPQRTSEVSETDGNMFGAPRRPTTPKTATPKKKVSIQLDMNNFEAINKLT